MRVISIDTETTGSSPAKGDRCVEIGAAELIDGRLTGRTFQTYLNPERPVAWQAERVHGLSNRFLADKPLFREIASNLLDFIGDAPCVAHNARFDRDMILYDFRYAGLDVPKLRFYDSLPFAERQVRAPSYRLDQLAMSLGVMERGRGLHGALEDAVILGRVLQEIEARLPGALSSWMHKSAPLNPLPKNWQVPSAPSTGPDRGAPQKTARPASPHLSAEVVEANRIASLIHMALEGAPDLPSFAERLDASGILLRPFINGELALQGVRFSTPGASFTGGAIGLTVPRLERAGPVYRHAEHAPLVARLVAAHDAVMGPVTALKWRFSAVPSEGFLRPQSARRAMLGEAGSTPEP